jgi:hypothetical protein
VVSCSRSYCRASRSYQEEYSNGHQRRTHRPGRHQRPGGHPLDHQHRCRRRHPRGSLQLRRDLHVGLREGLPPQAQPPLREGEDVDVERRDRPPLGHRGRSGSRRDGQRHVSRWVHRRHGERAGRHRLCQVGPQGVDPDGRREPELDALAVPARRAGRARVHGQDRRVGPVDRRQVLRVDAGGSPSTWTPSCRATTRSTRTSRCCSTTSSPTAAGT